MDGIVPDSWLWDSDRSVRKGFIFPNSVRLFGSTGGVVGDTEDCRGSGSVEGSVPVRPLPDRCSTVSAGRVNMQDGMVPVTAWRMVYALEKDSSLSPQAEDELNPSSASVFSVVQPHTVSGRVPEKQLPTAVITCRGSKNNSAGNGPVS